MFNRGILFYFHETNVIFILIETNFVFILFAVMLFGTLSFASHSFCMICSQNVLCSVLNEG